MRVVTWNVNGIRAALKNGLPGFVTELCGDVWMLQEVRAQREQLPTDFRLAEGLDAIWHPAQKPGYSGVLTAGGGALGMKELARGIDTSLDATRDPEGRVLCTKHGDFECINVYLPNGSSSEERQRYKDAWCRDFLKWLLPRTKKNTPVLVCGDLNVAHTEDDIWDPRGNRETSGFLAHERDWFTQLLQSGWSDLLRDHIGAKKGPYSWWSNRGNARALDRGWRIDYVLGNRAARERLSGAFVERRGGLEVSDHAPVVVDFAD
jgi:exodeoxyribonuclease III